MKIRFIDNKDGTIMDISTGLMWQKETHNQMLTWQEAMDYCRVLNLAGYKDWKLPAKKELISLIDDERCNPSIDPVFQCFASNYWSSTPYVGCTSNVWYVYFGYGVDSDYGSKSYSYYVRAVRMNKKKK